MRRGWTGRLLEFLLNKVRRIRVSIYISWRLEDGELHVVVLEAYLGIRILLYRSVTLWGRTQYNDVMLYTHPDPTSAAALQ